MALRLVRTGWARTVNLDRMQPMIEETYQETRDRMGKTITALKNE
jgi:hypothetical protein